MIFISAGFNSRTVFFDKVSVIILSENEFFFQILDEIFVGSFYDQEKIDVIFPCLGCRVLIIFLVSGGVVSFNLIFTK